MHLQKSRILQKIFNKYNKTLATQAQKHYFLTVIIAAPAFALLVWLKQSIFLI